MDAKEAELRAEIATSEAQLKTINDAIAALERQRWFIIDRKDSAQRELQKVGT